MKSFIIFQNTVPMSVEFAQEAISEAKKFGIDLRGWVGTNGLTETHKFKEYGIKNFLQDKIEKLPGVQGCFLSHYELWEKCVKHNETMLILEHDGIFIRPLPVDVEDHFEHVLNLDPCDQFSDTYNEKIQNSLTLPIKYQSIVATGADKAGPYMAGAYGYLIKPEGARRLINFAKTRGALPTDKHIGSAIVDIKTTTVPVVRLHKFFSHKNLRKFSLTKNLKGLTGV